MTTPKLNTTRSKYVTANPEFDLDAWSIQLWTNPKGDLVKKVPADTIIGMMMDDVANPNRDIDSGTKELPFLVKIVSGRFKFLQQKPSTALCWLVAMMCSNPGQAVMLCTSLAVMYERRRDTDVRFNLTWFCSMLVDIDNTEWMESSWPVPSEEDMHAMWDLQKFRGPGQIGDNLLDTVTIKNDTKSSDDDNTSTEHPPA